MFVRGKNYWGLLMFVDPQKHIKKSWHQKAQAQNGKNK
jgi:hypothetical protein